MKELDIFEEVTHTGEVCEPLSSLETTEAHSSEIFLPDELEDLTDLLAPWRNISADREDKQISGEKESHPDEKSEDLILTYFLPISVQWAIYRFSQEVRKEYWRRK